MGRYPTSISREIQANRMKVKTYQKHRYFYSAKKAEALSYERRSESCKGIQLSEKELQEMDTLISGLVKKGQPLSHIYLEHGISKKLDENVFELLKANDWYVSVL